MTKEEFNKISRANTVFCMLPTSTLDVELTSDEQCLQFNYEEVFINLVNHAKLQFGENGKEWLKKMSLNTIGCTCLDCEDHIPVSAPINRGLEIKIISEGVGGPGSGSGGGSDMFDGKTGGGGGDGK